MLKFIRLRLCYIPLVATFFISSCSTFDPPTVVPIYGHIDSIHFSVPLDSMPKQGTSSSYIPYAWVYLDDNPVGVFQLPCTFPMLGASGAHNVKIYPGVTPAGMLSPASIYPFYQFYSFNITMQQGSTYKFHPTSTYYPWVQFVFKENFSEGNGAKPTGIINFGGNGNSSAASNTSMYVTTNPHLAFDGNGNGSGIVVVNSTTPYYIGLTNPGNFLPNSSTSVYVELNYRCNATFAIGLFEGDSTAVTPEGDTANQASPTAVVYPAPKWTKMYVSLNSTLQQFSGSSSLHAVYFSMKWNQGDPTNDTLLLDNIKILY